MSKRGKQPRSDPPLTIRPHWRGSPRFFLCLRRPARLRAELRKSFVELLGELHHVAYGGSRLPRALRGLPRNAGNDLHRVCDAFRSAYLLLGSEGNFLNEFG